MGSVTSALTFPSLLSRTTGYMFQKETVSAHRKSEPYMVSSLGFCFELKTLTVLPKPTTCTSGGSDPLSPPMLGIQGISSGSPNSTAVHQPPEIDFPHAPVLIDAAKANDPAPYSMLAQQPNMSSLPYIRPAAPLPVYAKLTAYSKQPIWLLKR